MISDEDELLAVPRLASALEQLQSEIDNALGNNGEYAAPTSGYNRQSIQMMDLNGDGTEEAVVFIRTSNEKPLKICLFENHDGIYSFRASVEGEGTSFDSVSYYDINGDGYREIIVGRALGTGLPKAVSIYSLTDDGFYELMSNTYTGYSVMDIDRDEDREMIIVRYDEPTSSGVVEVHAYSKSDNAMMLKASTFLSTGLESLTRIRTGYLIDMIPAIFISGQCNNKTGIATDICAFRDGEFVNITIDPETGMSREIVSQYTVYCSDLTGDSIYEFPQTIAVRQYETQKSSETFWKIVWRNYDIYGKAHEVMQTYHNYSDGWYFIIPNKWKNNITVDRRDYVSGERTIVFSIYSGNSTLPTDMLAIYTLTGDNKEDRSALTGRFEIKNDQSEQSRMDTIFAARIYELDSDMRRYAITEDDVINSFKFIQTEWLSGELSS